MKDITLTDYDPMDPNQPEYCLKKKLEYINEGIEVENPLSSLCIFHVAWNDVHVDCKLCYKYIRSCWGQNKNNASCDLFVRRRMD